MNLLAIESATELVGAAWLGDAGEASRSSVDGRRHAEDLLPHVAAVTAELRVELRRLDAVAVDAGPGLFTGLRVGVATAKALADALSIGVVAVSSTDIVAAAAAEACGDGPRVAVVAVDGRRRELFVAPYRLVGGRAEALTDGARRVGTDAFPAHLEELVAAHGSVLAVGDGLVRVADRLPDGVDASLALGDDPPALRPRPEVLARLARSRLSAGETEPLPAREVVANYLREADVKITWETRAAPGART